MGITNNACCGDKDNIKHDKNIVDFDNVLENVNNII